MLDTFEKGEQTRYEIRIMKSVTHEITYMSYKNYS
jgi:hypothetical protein